MITVCKRELSAVYHSFIGWLIALTLLLVGGIYTWVYCCLRGAAQFEYVLSSLEIFLIFIIPVLTMRSFAEERKQKTDRLLYSLPVTMSAVVWGKYIAMVLVLALPLAVLALYPLLLSLFGSMNFAMVYGNLLSYFLLACALTALGEFISACTDNPTVALILTLLAMLVCHFVGGLHTLLDDGNVLTAALGGLMETLSLFSCQTNFRAGLFDLGAVAYYAAFTVIFLQMAVLVMEKRRWS